VPEGLGAGTAQRGGAGTSNYRPAPVVHIVSGDVPDRGVQTHAVVLATQPASSVSSTAGSPIAGRSGQSLEMTEELTGAHSSVHLGESWVDVTVLPC
jgi:hypothetical protein